MIVRPAEAGELLELDSLRRRDQEAVGFVPLDRLQADLDRDAMTVLTGWENGDMVGHLWWTRGLPVASIQQVVIREDARRRERGTALVGAALDAMRQDERRYGVTCRCRVDLAATDFWLAAGFKAVRLEESGRRGPCLRLFRELRPTLFDLGLYLPMRGITQGGSRIGFRPVTGLSTKRRPAV